MLNHIRMNQQFNSVGQKVYLAIPSPEELQQISSVKPDYEYQELDPRIGVCNNPTVFLIRKIDTDTIIGTIGFYNRKDNAAELGITIPYVKEWNKGYGKEAINLLCHLLYNKTDIRTLFLKVVSTNYRAIRCYESCGFSYWFDGYMEKYHMLFLIKDLS